MGERVGRVQAELRGAGGPGLPGDRTLPLRHSQRTRIRPVGGSSTRSVYGSDIATMPVSSGTVATQIVFDPDIAGYSLDSRIT